MLPSHSIVQPARRVDPARREIKVVVVDDEYEIRKTARLCLDRVPGVRVIAEAADADYGQIAIELQSPDVAVVELEMQRVNGMDLARRLRALKLPVKLILVTAHTTEAVAKQAFAAGYRGLVAKPQVAQELALAVLAVSSGRTYLSEDFRRSWLG